MFIIPFNARAMYFLFADTKFKYYMYSDQKFFLSKYKAILSEKTIEYLKGTYPGWDF